MKSIYNILFIQEPKHASVYFNENNIQGYINEMKNMRVYERRVIMSMLVRKFMELCDIHKDIKKILLHFRNDLLALKMSKSAKENKYNSNYMEFQFMYLCKSI